MCTMIYARVSALAPQRAEPSRDKNKMSKDKTIFIDGEAGTTGLQIRDRLANLKGVTVKSIDADKRKDPAARKEMMADVDLAVLCLPDDAAREATGLADELGAAAPRLLDASTAHRTKDGWVYGFAELKPGQEQKELIRHAARVANPGCYATGAIALIKPLLTSEWFQPDEAFTVNAVSGYSGGGKSMIADFETGNAPAFHLYGLTLNHKHLPEIVAHTGLATPPLFVPSVGNFPQGMLVSLPLQLGGRSDPPTASDLEQLFLAYYGPDGAGQVVVHEEEPARLSADASEGDDAMHIYILANEARKQVLLVAQLDNLGKGAAGAAVQNIKLMLGL